MNKAPKTCSCLLLLTAAYFCMPFQTGAKTSDSLSAADIKAAVERADNLDTEYKQQIYASCHNGLVSVSLFRHPEASKEDCKISAVLIAHKIINLSPGEVKYVRCVFYDYDRQNQYWSVEVRAQLVAAFGSGKIGSKELLDSLILVEDEQKNPLGEKYKALSYGSIINEDSVCRGAFEDSRLAIYLRLKELEQNKIGTAQFRDDFLRLEDAARRGKNNQELNSQIKALNNSLDKYVQEMIASGQMQKPELRRRKTAANPQGQPALEPLMGLQK